MKLLSKVLQVTYINCVVEKENTVIDDWLQLLKLKFLLTNKNVGTTDQWQEPVSYICCKFSCWDISRRQLIWIWIRWFIEIWSWPECTGSILVYSIVHMARMKIKKKLFKTSIFKFNRMAVFFVYWFSIFFRIKKPLICPDFQLNHLAILYVTQH